MCVFLKIDPDWIVKASLSVAMRVPDTIYLRFSNWTIVELEDENRVIAANSAA